MRKTMGRLRRQQNVMGTQDSLLSVLFQDLTMHLINWLFSWKAVVECSRSALGQSGLKVSDNSYIGTLLTDVSRTVGVHPKDAPTRLGSSLQQLLFELFSHLR